MEGTELTQIRLDFVIRLQFLFINLVAIYTYRESIRSLIIWRRVFYWDLNHSQIPYATSSGTRVAYFPYVTFVSVVSFNDVTIPAFCFCFIFPKIFKTRKITSKPNLKYFRNFPKISEDFRTLPKISKDFPKIFKNPKTHKKRFLNIYEAFRRFSETV